MSQCHKFDPDHAEKFGIAEAILLDHLAFWLSKNKANDRNYHDGLWWTYNSVEAYSKLFPYLTKSKIRAALDHLEKEGLIVTGNYNKSSYDRTKWYALTVEGWALFGESICDSGEIHFLKNENGSEQKSKPIPASTSLLPEEKPKRGARFTPPTREDVAAYAKEKGYADFDPDLFMAYYEANGWMTGKTKMKSWRGAVAMWNMREKKWGGRKSGRDPNNDGAFLDPDFAVKLQAQADADTLAMIRGELFAD